LVKENIICKSFFIQLLFFVGSIISYTNSSLSQYKLVLDSTQVKTEFKDTLSINTFLNSKIEEIKLAGYPLAYITQAKWIDSINFVSINKGKQYQIEISNLKEFKLKHGGDFRSTEKLIDNTLINYANNGYPFARVFFVPRKFINDSVCSGEIQVVKRDLFIIDSISIKGNFKTNLNIVKRVTGLRKGQVYSREDIENVSNNLRQCNFLKELRGPDVYFSPKKALVVIYVEDVSNNELDGLVGINNDEQTGDLVITGNANINLTNSLKYGENIIFNWNKSQVNTQTYYLETSVPYIANSNFGVTGNISNTRQDTIFSNTAWKAGITFKPKINQTLELNVSSLMSVNLLLDDSDTNRTSSVLYYGFKYHNRTVDNWLNPRKGFEVEVLSDIGNKRFSTNERFIQYQLGFTGKAYIPLFKRQTLAIMTKNKFLISEKLVENEFYLIGGTKTLRGFNEQTFLVSQYSIQTVEYRYILDERSNVFAFTDVGFIKTFDQDLIPFGFGAGINLGVKGGIINLAYALGKVSDNPILIRNSKIHFGFTSIF